MRSGSDPFLSALPDAVLELDASGKLTGWHGAAEHLFGWSAEEAVGQDVNRLLKPRLPRGEPTILPQRESPDRPQPLGDEAKNSSIQGFEQELLVKAKDDSDIWVSLVYGAGTRSDGGSPGVIAALRDIRHRKNVDLEKSDVISAVAHELRSPLTSIKGFASTLVRRWDRFDDDRRRQILSTIETDADRVTRLINELLDLSRLEEGRLQLLKQPVQVSQIADRVIGRLKDASSRHSLSCSFASPFPTVMADPDKVEQVLTNLVENAVKYTEQGRVRIMGETDAEVVRIAVADEGSGIPEQDRTKVFRKFFRRVEVSSSDSPLRSGSGLGLYISKGLIEAHGGKIWIEEASGGGASFTFTLPLN